MVQADFSVIMEIVFHLPGCVIMIMTVLEAVMKVVVVSNIIYYTINDCDDDNDCSEGSNESSRK